MHSIVYVLATIFLKRSESEHFNTHCDATFDIFNAASDFVKHLHSKFHEYWAWLWLDGWLFRWFICKFVSSRKMHFRELFKVNIWSLFLLLLFGHFIYKYWMYPLIFKGGQWALQSLSTNTDINSIVVVVLVVDFI